MKPRTLKDLRKAATPDHIAALTRTAKSHPDPKLRESAVQLLAALTTPDAPKPAPRSPALLAELASRGHVIRTTPEEAVALMRSGHVRTASDAPATHDDPAFDEWLSSTLGGGGDRIDRVVADRRAATAARTALAQQDPAEAQHRDEMDALGLSELTR